MKKTLFLSFTFFAITLQAQEKYKVIMDYATGSVTYYHVDKNNKIDDTLAKPKFKRHSLIEVQLKNVNPFAVNVETNVTEETIHQNTGGFNFTGLLGGLSSFSGDKLKLNVQNLPIDEKVFGTRGASRGPAMTNKFAYLNEVTTNVDALKNSFLSNLVNPNLGKDKILQNLKDLAKVQVDARLSNPEENFYLYLSNLEKIVQTDKQNIISDISILSSELEQVAESKTASRGELIAQNTAFKDLQTLINSLNESTAQTTENLNKIKALYSLLEASSFEQTFDYQLESDKANLNLKFIPSTFSQEVDGKLTNSTASAKTRTIQLMAKGGFKVNTSVALTLNTFGKKSKDYFIDENGIIASDTNDYFVPNLSTMINFYPVIGENFNLGGSFGLSIPIADNIKGMNFLLGPSLFFGSKSRVSISGGIVYGAVNKLTNGLEEGDYTELRELDNFNKKVYDLGYYFGISFSLFDIK